MAQGKRKQDEALQEMPEALRRRDQPQPDAPATVPQLDDEAKIQGVSPPEDGGVDQHPIHDDDLEDLGPEDYEELTDEAQLRFEGDEEEVEDGVDEEAEEVERGRS